MRVYIPFEDGSAVSYDGKSFVIHKQPVDMNSDWHSMPESMAGLRWRVRRQELVKALEAAWWSEKMRFRERAAKKIYSRHGC